VALRLLEKDPDRRYQSADDVRVDLERARRGEPPLPLKPPSRANAVSAATRAAGSSDPTTALDATVDDPPGTVGSVSVAAGGRSAAEDTGRTVVRSPQERRARVAGYLALAAVLVLVILGARAALTANPGPGPEVEVPRVTGLTFEAAVEALAEAELRLGRVSEVETEASAPGTVLTQRPEPGSLLPAAAGVDLTIARSPALTTVPTIAGIGEAEALRRLRDAGLTPGTRVRAPSDTLPAGTVITTQPGPGTRVAVGSIVEVTISDGPARARVPPITNRPLAEAVNRLRDQGFDVEIYEEANPAVAAGLVIRQLPSAGQEAVLGSRVMLWVSTGPDGTAPLPDVPEPDPEPEAEDGNGGDGGGNGGG